MLAIRQVAPCLTSVSCRCRIWSRSPVRLKANITFLPVRGAWPLITRMTDSHPLVEWARRTVRLQFVVLDKIDAGAAEVIDESRRLGGTQADAWLDDRPDQRSSLNAYKAARPCDAEPRPRIGLRKLRRQADIGKTQPCNRLELEQIAGVGADSATELPPILSKPCVNWC